MIYDSISQMLRSGQWETVVNQALNDRRIVRTLLKLLYDQNDYTHWLAAEAVGRYGAALADVDPEKVREFVRRLLWNLNEECGSSPFGAVEAIGAITVERPDLFADYLSIIYPFHEDDALCPGVIWTYCQVGRKQPELVSEYQSFLIAGLNRQNVKVRAYAAWALGHVGTREGAEALKGLIGDDNRVSIYDRDGCYWETTVGATARESCDKLASVLLLP